MNESVELKEIIKQSNGLICPWCDYISIVLDKKPCDKYDCAFYDYLIKTRKYKMEN